jgi:hypothetical protein
MILTFFIPRIPYPNSTGKPNLTHLLHKKLFCSKITKKNIANYHRLSSLSNRFNYRNSLQSPSVDGWFNTVPFVQYAGDTDLISVSALLTAPCAKDADVVCWSSSWINMCSFKFLCKKLNRFCQRIAFLCALHVGHTVPIWLDVFDNNKKKENYSKKNVFLNRKCFAKNISSIQSK